MRSMRCGSVTALLGALCVVTVLCPGKTWAQEMLEEPDGYGKAKFGMSIEQVLKLYPQLQKVEPPDKGAGRPAGMQFDAYRMEGLTVGPLNRCKSEFRFFKAELYEIQFRCPNEDPYKVTQYLIKRFGLAKTMETALLWQGKKAAVTVVPASGAFMFGDLERTHKFQAMLMAYTMQLQQTPGTVQSQPPVAPPAAPKAGQD